LQRLGAGLVGIRQQYGQHSAPGGQWAWELR
jgi:hypothetical protein